MSNEHTKQPAPPLLPEGEPYTDIVFEDHQDAEKPPYIEVDVSEGSPGIMGHWKRTPEGKWALRLPATPEQIKLAAQLQRERDEARERALHWQRTVSNATPGGSEFVSSPERCVEWLEQRIGNYMERCKEVVQLNRQLREANHQRDAAVARAEQAERSLRLGRGEPVEEDLPEGWRIRPNGEYYVRKGKSYAVVKPGLTANGVCWEWHFITRFGGRPAIHDARGKATTAAEAIDAADVALREQAQDDAKGDDDA